MFLDDDIVVQRDLAPLWDVDLEGKVNGAVETCKGDDEWERSCPGLCSKDKIIPLPFPCCYQVMLPKPRQDLLEEHSTVIVKESVECQHLLQEETTTASSWSLNWMLKHAGKKAP